MTDAVWRDVHHGRVWRAQACRIVEETANLVALWVPVGAPAKIPAGGLRIPSDDWELEDSASSWHALCLATPGRRHSIWIHWEEPRGYWWYVNFEQPLRRAPVGFDTFDEKLDLVVERDGSYRWKDEDELEQAAALGLLDADEVRAEAARVLDEWPFPTGWEEWRPDPSWPIPQLPDGWDRV